MKRASRKSGFTLVEVLVAVAITVVIAATLLVVTDGTLRLWRRAQDGFATDATAQVIFDYFQRDLNGALFRADGNVWLACTNFDGSVASHGWIAASRPKPSVRQAVPAGAEPAIGDARFGRSGDWLRFFTTTGGRPIAVGYQIVRRAPSSAITTDTEAVRYALFRAVVTDETTFAGGYAIAAHDAALIAPSFTYEVGNNVVDLGVWLHRREPGGALTRIHPVLATDASYTAASAAAFPDVVDVMIRVLTDEGATTLSAMERGVVPVPAEYAGRTDAWWWDFVNAHSRVYVRRFEVAGGAR
jgi:prepilin-type N-terminal cleavage/methylation domain-containing protein